MYDLRPPAVYVHETVAHEPRLAGRVDRVVAALAEAPEPVVYRDEDLPALVRDAGLVERASTPMGTMDDVPDPILLFNTFRFDGRREERLAWLAEHAPAVGGYHTAEALMGYGAFSFECYGQEGDPKRSEKVCRPCWRLHFQNGCAHKCHYCGLGGLLATMVNVEDYVGQLDRLIDLHPWQETFLLEDDADVLCLEPELGCLGELIRSFGTRDGKYLILHTKSANVDWMLDLPHGGNTVFAWSLAGPEQAEWFEPVTGDTDERIAAAARAERAGYPVRFKFKPIIPTRSWRREASETVEKIFAATRPDIISLCVFMWMDLAEMRRRLRADRLDPEMVAAAEDAADRIGDLRTAPFPDDAREQIYRHYVREIRRHDPEVRISLSTESPGMWKRMGPMLDATASDYVCACGPNSTPGRRKLEINPFAVAVPDPAGGFETL